MTIAVVLLLVLLLVRWFRIGWTPCIGPVLAGILTAAATAASALWGAALLLTYSLGLGIPFMLLASGVRSRRAPVGAGCGDAGG